MSAAVATSCFGVVGCVPKSLAEQRAENAERYGEYTGAEHKLVDFATDGGRSKFRASTGYGNGRMFDCDWLAANAAHSGADADKYLALRLTNVGGKIYGAEYQSFARYGYGYYSTMMKAVKREGAVSSFFVYTYYPVWDEIDIEFLGKDTGVVQFNYFTSGVGNHERTFRLGFDASADFHEYGFKWEQGKITWYVDGVGVYSTTDNTPTHNAQIMINVWNGKSEGEHSVKNWLGVYDKSDASSVQAEYKWIGYRAI